MINKAMNHIKKCYSSHKKIKLVATFVLVCLIVNEIRLLPSLSLKKEKLPEIPQHTLTKTATELGNKNKRIQVAKSDSYELYVDMEELVLTVRNTKNNVTWSSAVKDSVNGVDKALLIIDYLGEDNNLYQWNTYDNSVMMNSYQAYQIENGVQIHMNVNEGESSNFYEYLPQKLSIERYEEFFVQGINQKIQDGTLDAQTGAKFKKTLSLIYKKSQVEECYAVAYKGKPPSSAVNQLIEMTKVMGYTTEMLLEDSEAFGLTVSFRKPAIFDVVMEIMLENDELVVRVPVCSMQSGNDYYTIQNVKVLPNFGAVSVSEEIEGYVLVPDGAGALMKFNTANTAVADYVRPFYDNDYFSDYYFMPEYGEELMMPVFGMLYGAENPTHGFMGIIEDGADTSWMNVKLASRDGKGTVINKAYVSFDTLQYNKVKIYGPYSDKPATYLSSTGTLDIDYKIRYKLYENPVTYFEMAKDYQTYLMKQEGIEALNYSSDTKLYLEMVGALTLTERLLGIPYDALYSMTEYEQLQEILMDLEGMNVAIQYDGFFNNGVKNTVNNKADVVGVNGSKSELKALKDYVNQQNIDLFYQVQLNRVGKLGEGFLRKQHAIYDYSNAPAEVYRYTPAIGIFDGYLSNTKFSSYFVSPYYLSSITDKFLKDSTAYDALAVGDLANTFYADYKFHNVVSPYIGKDIVTNNLKKLKDAKKLSMYDPRMEYIGMSTYATDISRESSDYATFYTTIPFRQLVMNGITTYTTENVNMSSMPEAYYVLQAAELGSDLKFLLTAKNVDVLKNSSYSYLYSTQYKNWEDSIKAVYDECSLIFKQIGTKEIVKHSLLAENIFCTEYATGVKVITNYNKTACQLEDGTVIAGLDYLIIE